MIKKIFIVKDETGNVIIHKYQAPDQQRKNGYSLFLVCLVILLAALLFFWLCYPVERLNHSANLLDYIAGNCHNYIENLRERYVYKTSNFSTAHKFGNARPYTFKRRVTNNTQQLEPCLKLLEMDVELFKNVNNEEKQNLLKKAFRKVALKYHPDKNKSKDASNMMARILQARDVIENFIRRSSS